MIYNDPNSSPSSISNSSTSGEQFNLWKWHKKALIDIREKQYFGQLAKVRAMPKHMGKKIKQYHYIPLLDDRNINDQGLDASGAVIADTEYALQAPTELNNIPTTTEALEASFAAAHSSGDYVFITDSSQWVELTADTAIGYDASTTGGVSGTELTDANIKALIEADTSGATATVTNNDIDLTSASLVYASEAAATIVANIIGGSLVTQRSGNLYGGSKDVGLITAKMPALTENGGKVNRVGFTRLTLEGSIVKQGFYSAYTKESMDFDTDDELMMHITAESLVAANEMTEDNLQLDLLNGAGVVRYGGVATQNSEITAEGSDASILTYEDLMRLWITLDNNKCPKSTKIISGSRMIDTRVVHSARYIYCGSEMLPTLYAMTDLHSLPAWKSVEEYADAGNIAMGEAGAIGQFRFIIVPEMMRWQGAGAAVGTNPGYLATSERYDVAPLLVVGSDSFATIGFQTDGKTVKFKVIHRPPESGKDSSDPFEETGTYAIKWYYGSMILRSEWIAVIKTVAAL